ncbi:hypothetical protein CSKR_103342 [Clonorchis sinensis]|uniref:Uncharacterized protein n=1 Tax=Clonorchis sinensis TaxID=79923 RepID=A0A3R7G949_CLOSI|nr:hypothetical protein CSKR_103342 [Clonorchis sinensis]
MEISSFAGPLGLLQLPTYTKLSTPSIGSVRFKKTYVNCVLDICKRTPREQFVPTALEADNESFIIVSMTELKRNDERGQPCLTTCDVVNYGQSFSWSFARSRELCLTVHRDKDNFQVKEKPLLVAGSSVGVPKLSESENVTDAFSYRTKTSLVFTGLSLPVFSSVDRISWYRARLFPVANAFFISRLFDVHQSSRSFLRLFTVWCLRDLRVPSYSLLDIDTVELRQFFEVGVLIANLRGQCGKEQSYVLALIRDRNQVLCPKTNNLPLGSQHPCFHDYGHDGRLRNSISEKSTNLTPRPSRSTSTLSLESESYKIRHSHPFYTPICFDQVTHVNPS